MKSEIYCEHPVLILNPAFSRHVVTYGCYVTPFGTYFLSSAERDYYSYKFPDYKFSPKRMLANSQNYKSFYSVDKSTGSFVPMFQLVPCGRCLLCRKKSATQWSFRALAENTTSSSIPLFVTLTFNNENLPFDGVNKRHVQLFLKRLRISMQRQGFIFNLRYFACAEYGTSSGRPHYHLIFWNFPRDRYFISLTNVLSEIEKAWPFGFCYCVPLKKGCVGYVMKYLRKPPVIPKGCNKTFYLTSRRNGGIGSSYARQFIDYYRANPDVDSISVTDPYSGQSMTIALPQYYKNLFFPPLSSVVSKQIRDLFKQLCKCIRLRAHIAFLAGGNSFVEKLSPIEIAIFKKFKALHMRPSTYIQKLTIQRLSDVPRETFSSLYNYYDAYIQSICKTLSCYKLDFTLLNKLKCIKEKRYQHFLSLSVNTPISYDIDAERYKIVHDLADAVRYEKI